MADELGPIISIWQMAGSTYQNLWTFFIVVVSAVLGFSFSETFKNLSRSIHHILVVILALFLISSAVSMWDVLHVYNTAVQELQNSCSHTEQPLCTVVTSIEKIPTYLVMILHGLLDVGALTMVWKAREN